MMVDIARLATARPFGEEKLKDITNHLTAGSPVAAARPIDPAACRPNRRRQRGATVSGALVAAATALLSGGNQHFARAAIVIDPNFLRADFDVSAEANGGGTTDDREVQLDAPRGFTSFSVSQRTVNASRSGPNGSASASAGGSSNTTVSLTGEVLSVESAASFNTSASFTRATGSEGLSGHGVGSGGFSLTVPIRTTRPYEYSFSGRAVHDIDAGTGIPRSRTRLRFFGASGDLLELDDDRRSGSGTVPVSGSGELRVGDHSLNLDLNVFAAQNPSLPGRSGAEGSFDFLLTLRPLSRWERPVSGSFQVADNWTGGFLPGQADIALFDRPGTYTARLDQDVSNHAMRVNGNGVNLTLDLNGNRYALKNMDVGAGASLVVKGSGGPVGIAAVSPQGQRGSIPIEDTLRIVGLLEVVEGGAETAGRAIVDGTLQIRDAASIAEFNALSVGTTPSSAGGLVGVSNGGKLVTTNFAALAEQPGFAFGDPVIGNVIISNAGSIWEHRGERVTIGAGGDASLRIFEGGKFTTTDGVVHLATGSGSNGTLEVVGDGSVFTAKFLKVGEFGKGETLVRAGGILGVRDLEVVGAPDAPSTVTIVGAGSNLGVTGQTSIKGAVGGSGTLTVGPGGSALLVNTNVGFGGQFAVRSGAALGFATDALVVESGGEFNVRDGSGATARDAKIGGGVGGAQSLAVVEGTGSALHVIDTLTIPSRGTVTARGGGLVQVDDTLNVGVGGALRVEPGGMVNLGLGAPVPNRLRIGPGGTLSGGGQVLAGGVVRSGGNMGLGNSPGMLTLIGNYEEEAGVGGVLDVEIGGTTPVTLYDVLRVEGNASLAGDLRLTFIDGFSPRAGDAFEFLDLTGTLSGSFAGVEVRNLAPGFQFDLSRDAGGMTLVALNDGVFVPEPGAAGTMLVLAVFGLKRRRRDVRLTEE